MTKENKKRLVDLYLEVKKKNYPDFPVPYFAIPKYSEKGANALTKCVVDWINFSGGQAERISTTGRYIDNSKTVIDVIGRSRKVGSGKFIPGTGTKGSADISATIKPKAQKGDLSSAFGVSVKIEIKYGKDKMSENQKKYEAHINSAGGVYIIVNKFDEFVKWYDDFTGNALNLNK